MIEYIIAATAGAFIALISKDVLEYIKGRKVYKVQGHGPSDLYFLSPFSVAAALSLTDQEINNFMEYIEEDEREPFKLGRVQVYQKKARY